MRARVAVAVAGSWGALEPGEVVDDRHRCFAGTPGLWARYVAAGVLEPLAEEPVVETAMVQPPENAMRPRPRGRFAARVRT